MDTCGGSLFCLLHPAGPLAPRLKRMDGGSRKGMEARLGRRNFSVVFPFRDKYQANEDMAMMTFNLVASLSASDSWGLKARDEAEQESQPPGRADLLGWLLASKSLP